MRDCSNVTMRERLPVHDEKALILPRPVDRGGVQVDPSFRDVADFARTSRTMSGVAAVWHYGARPATLLDGERSLVLQAVQVSPNYFDVLGARPAVGRLLRPEDGVRGAPRVLVIGYAAWKREFGGDAGVIGRRLVEGYTRWSYTIVGVAPPGLDYPSGVELWGPVPPESDGVLVETVARLAPGATLGSARAEFFQFMRGVEPTRGATSTLLSAEIRPFTEQIIGDARPVLTVLAAAVALLLLIACVNVGNLLLLRSLSRGRELAVRRAVGASYGDLVRHLFVESLLLGAAGGVIGTALAAALLRILLVAAPGQLPRMEMIQVAGMPLAATTAITSLAVLLFGLGTALSAARADVGSMLRSDARSGRETRGRARVRRALVAAQVALALVMLSGAGLLIRSLQRLEHIDLGYAPEHVGLFVIAYPALKYDTLPKVLGLGNVLVPRLRAVPGVSALSPMIGPPFMGRNLFIIKLATESQTNAEAATNPFVPWEVAGADFFKTFGIPLLRGRAFTDADREGAPRVAIVTEALARRLWPNEEPIGKRVRSPYEGPTARPITVVGMVGDTHYRALRDPTPVIYFPWQQLFWSGYVAVRTTVPFARVLPALEREMHAVEPQLVVWRAQPLDELLAGPLARPRLSTFLLSGFGAVALLLAAMALYGILASAVRERTREMGVRLALGASPERLRRGVLAEAMGMTLGGAVVGLVGALAMSGLVGSLLFEVRPTDPLALAAACVVLLVVALGAAYLPARRVTRIDPARALRED